MSKIFKDCEPVLIKTYLFESGLWYLAKSLADTLIHQGHKVFFIPKSKYQLINEKFQSIYLKPKNESEFLKYNLINLQKDISLNHQIYKAVEDNKIKYLISFETFMERSDWIPILKSRKPKNFTIIDVPMVEWVNPRLLESNSYKIFNEIWALNKLSERIFKDYSNLRPISWNWVDSDFFNLKGKILDKNNINFLHLASTNPEYSSKNTELTIQAFSKFIEKEKPSINCQLNIQGAVSQKFLHFSNRHGNIKINQEIINRKNLVDLYKKTDCLIAPSSREGLSLALYEGQASGCKIITTDAEPMNYIKTSYLCRTSGVRRDRSLIPYSIVDPNSLYENIKLAYKDIKNEQN